MAGFEQVLGQEHIKKFFRNAAATGNVPHACIPVSYTHLI